MSKASKERTRQALRVEGTDFERVAANERVPGGVRLSVAYRGRRDGHGPTFYVYRLDSLGLIVPPESMSLWRRPLDSPDWARLRRVRLEAAVKRTQERAIVNANPACPTDHIDRRTLSLLWAIAAEDTAVIQDAGLDPASVLDMDELPIFDEGPRGAE
ncbi:hypothetical protein [Mesorhizobium sp. AA22]|uniref:hypothetical protein n=1 Tax=Mesorhizobium sp. AA22 TaxID=1854057 RepID=UPI0007FC2BE5|nr:hypothetical protein [Mesorhizobium sp. AA22]QIA23280.1 hypothetical protein A9K68_017000 [Mesorhizobium sp. AA22]